jgi:nucleotide-binding universal stress UspA family protein
VQILARRRRFMFSRILVPIDLSERNSAAVMQAAEALASGGVVILLHVIEEIEEVPREEFDDFYGEFRQRAEQLLAELRGKLEPREIAVETQVRMGRRGAEIVRCSREEGCDLIVLRSHALDPEEPMRGIGTVSHQVALAAPCGVLLLR